MKIVNIVIAIALAVDQIYARNNRDSAVKRPWGSFRSVPTMFEVFITSQRRINSFRVALLAIIARTLK